MSSSCKGVPEASAIDKLVTVSKIFADQRVSELLNENRKLRLQLFWRNHGVPKLKKAMKSANLKTGGPNCSCFCCAMSGRHHMTKDDDSLMEYMDECRFTPYFEALLLECGLEFQIQTINDNEVSREHMSNNVDGGRVYNIDTHLICGVARMAPSNVANWCGFSYGTKLWKAKRADNPELLKLCTLIDKLHFYPDSDEEDEQVG